MAYFFILSFMLPDQLRAFFFIENAILQHIVQKTGMKKNFYYRLFASKLQTKPTVLIIIKNDTCDVSILDRNVSLCSEHIKYLFLLTHAGLTFNGQRKSALLKLVLYEKLMHHAYMCQQFNKNTRHTSLPLSVIIFVLSVSITMGKYDYCFDHPRRTPFDHPKICHCIDVYFHYPRDILSLNYVRLEWKYLSENSLDSFAMSYNIERPHC